MIDIKGKFDSFYNSIIEYHRALAEVKYDRKHVWQYLTAENALTADEKRQIINRWKDVINVNPKLGFEYFQGVKPLYGFNPDFVPSSYFYPFIEGILNPKEWKKQLSHKSMIEMAYKTGISHPKTVLRTYGGAYFDSDYKPLTTAQALDVLKRCDSPLLFKPSTDSEQGAGIKLIAPSQIEELYEDIKTGAIFNPGTDFVLQHVVRQSEQTKFFNPSSLNCVRVTTININDSISVGSIAIKCGPRDSVVDNIGSGKRGVMIGLDEKGAVGDYGVYGDGTITKSHNGVTFKGKQIESCPLIISAAKTLHQYVPKCAVIGWDIALDENNKPVLIEGNTVYPGISLEQMCSGPVFGNRTDEVIDYLKRIIARKKLK